MITKVVAKLKTGTIKNVVPYGSALPAVPYVVVKEEPVSGLNEVRFRIIAHAAQGQQIVLDSYVKGELSTLLSGYATVDRFGNDFILSDRNEWGGVVANSDDGSISMERSFYSPLILF